VTHVSEVLTAFIIRDFTIKVKLSRYRHACDKEERIYSSYSFLTSALDRVSCQRHAPVTLYPREKEPRYPLYRKLGGPQSRFGHRGYKKYPLPLPWIKTPVFQLEIKTLSEM
jgi:hypothetical protein